VWQPHWQPHWHAGAPTPPHTWLRGRRLCRRLHCLLLLGGGHRLRLCLWPRRRLLWRCGRGLRRALCLRGCLLLCRGRRRLKGSCKAGRIPTDAGVGNPHEISYNYGRANQQILPAGSASHCAATGPPHAMHGSSAKPTFRCRLRSRCFLLSFRRCRRLGCSFFTSTQVVLGGRLPRGHAWHLDAHRCRWESGGKARLLVQSIALPEWLAEQALRMVQATGQVASTPFPQACPSCKHPQAGRQYEPAARDGGSLQS
jgi:hypothetical protein